MPKSVVNGSFVRRTNGRESFTNNERTNGLTGTTSADDLVAANAIRALAQRGVIRPEELLSVNTPIAILAWCRWWDQQRDVGKELLVERIRTGQAAPGRARHADHQGEYLASIARWVAAKLPDLCTVDQRVVEWERKLYGEASAAKLERTTSPHPAAIVAVLHLHHRNGKGSLTVREHGPVIRAAVRAANERAIADYQHLAKTREKEAAEHRRTLRVAVRQEGGGEGE